MMPLTTLCLLTFATLAAPPESVAVEVDASSITPEGPGIEKQLGGKVTSALEDRGVAVDGASTRRLRIEVRQTSFISYDVTLAVTVDGVVVTPGLEHVTCERCPLARMDEAVVAKLPDAIALMERADEMEPEPVEIGPQPEQEPDPEEKRSASGPDEEHDEPEREAAQWRLIGPLGISGIVVGTGGVIMVAAGAVKMISPPTVEKDTSAPEYDVNRDPESTGRALVITGAAIAAVSGVLVAVDLTVLRRKRREHAKMPVLHPSIGGFVIEGRF